jgi:hypothetical protein
MNRAVALLLLPLGCATGGYPQGTGRRVADPADALLFAGEVALTVATEPARRPAAASAPPRDRDARAPINTGVARIVTAAPMRIPFRPATIDGYVIGEERGWGIPFAVVKLAREHGPWEHVRADREGRFHIPPPLAAGHYTFEITDERWQGSAEIDVKEGVAANLRIEVRPRPMR